MARSPKRKQTRPLRFDELPHKLRRIHPVIASDVWSFGRREAKTVRIRIGAPHPVAGGRDWYTPFELSGDLPDRLLSFLGIKVIFGVGPVDSLMNAMSLVRELFDQVRPAPRGGSRRGATPVRKSAR